jgi:hypothetical protein
MPDVAIGPNRHGQAMLRRSATRSWLRIARKENGDECLQEAGGYWIDYYVNGHSKRERIGPDTRLLKAVLGKRKLEE